MSTLPREQLYAPAAPFAQAINDWLAQREKEAKASPYYGITCRTSRRYRTDVSARRRWKPTGIGQLARRAGLGERALRRYLDGETEWIELDCADRIAMALDIPLWLLADEFVPRSQSTRSGKKAA